MTLKSAAYFDVADNTTLEVSPEGLGTILGQIEAALYRSDTYRNTLASLQTMLGEAARTAQILIQLVSREAIQIAFEQLAKQHQVMLATTVGIDIPVDDRTAPAPQPQLPGSVPYSQPSVREKTETEEDAEEVEEADLDFELDSAEPYSVANDAAAPVRIPRLPFKGFGFPKKPQKFTVPPQTSHLERESRLRQIGQELGQARQARSLSIEHIHSQTLVPARLVEALENGNLELLPEDVYVRGFIRRIADALGLDGTSMAASLPAPDPVKSLVPSWYQTEEESGFDLRPVHLYVGYAALVAGAAGGLAWMSGQSHQGTVFETDPAAGAPASQSQSSRSAVPKMTPGIQLSKAGLTVGPDMAPPEVLGA